MHSRLFFPLTSELRRADSNSDSIGVFCIEVIVKTTVVCVLSEMMIICAINFKFIYGSDYFGRWIVFEQRLSYFQIAASISMFASNVMVLRAAWEACQLCQVDV